MLGMMMAAALATAPVGDSVTATNGVMVSLRGGDFDAMQAYGPDHKAGTSEYRICSTVQNGRVVSVLMIDFTTMVNIMGEPQSIHWKGGDSATIISVEPNALTPTLIRYAIQVSLAPNEVAAHADNGMLTVQLRTTSGDADVISLPQAEWAATREIASRKR